MTKEQLEQYTSIKEEIKELEAELDKRKSPVSDIVTGSMEDYPYTQQYYYTGIIERYIFSRFKTNLQKIQLERQRAEIENFLDSVQDSNIRRIIRLKYIKGKTWPQIARKMDKHISGDSVRKIVERFLEKN